MDPLPTDPTTDSLTAKPPRTKPSKEHMKALADKATAARQAKVAKRAKRIQAANTEPTDITTISSAKRKDMMVERASVLADRIYDEITEIYESGTSEKQSTRLRNLTWNYGVLHDKVVAKGSESAGQVRLPPRLLEAISKVIADQLGDSKPQLGTSDTCPQGMSPTNPPVVS